jgi:hypothetical protein
MRQLKDAREARGGEKGGQGMKNAMILTGIWLGILVTAYGIVYWDKGIDRPLPISVLEQQTHARPSEYFHPDGLFSVSIPVGWRVKENLAYVEMTGPNGAVTVWAVAVRETELARALDDAFSLVQLDAGFVSSFDAEAAEPWAGEETLVTYRRGVNDSVIYVRALRPDRITVVLLAMGPENALDALSENVDWIWSTVTIPAQELKIL